jgi:hypothetical protein
MSPRGGVDEMDGAAHPSAVNVAIPRLAGSLVAAWLLAAAPVRADVLAAGPGAEQPEAQAPPLGAVALDGAWNVCRVRVSVLLNTRGQSRVVTGREQLLALGENVDFSREVPLVSGDRHALVRLRVRLRASVARTPGVLYSLTTEAELASAIGFTSDDVGREQVRSALLDIADGGARLAEAFVSPELDARIVVAVTADPVFGREPLVGAAALAAPASAQLWQMRVEAVSKEGPVQTLLETTHLQAALGMPASFAMSRFGGGSGAVHPALRLGSTVRLVEPEAVAVSGYEKDHVVGTARADGSFVAEHAVALEDRYVDDHVVQTDRTDDPRHFTIRRANTKISEKKRQQLLDRKRIAAVREWVIERSKTLPGGEHVPEGFDREELSLEIVPLHATESSLQAELRLVGRVRLPRETEYTEVAATWIELLPLGETYEISVAELVREGDQKYDYLLRITPQQP